MARKHRPGAPLIPVRGNTYRPPLEQQRAMIERQRDEFRSMGYKAELDIEAISVQEAGDGEKLAESIKNLEHQRDNCYASARLMEEKLKKMPVPKKKPKAE